MARRDICRVLLPPPIPSGVAGPDPTAGDVTDGRGNLFKTAFDPLKRLISHIDPERHKVSFGLNASDQLVRAASNAV